MEADDLKHVRDTVNLIEERIPGGKLLTRIVLVLLLAMIAVWSFSYIWHTAVAPLGHIAGALANGTSFNIHVTLGTAIEGLAILLIYVGGFVAFNWLAVRVVNGMRHIQQHAQDSRRAAITCTDEAKKMVDIGLRMDKRVDELEMRLAALENKIAGFSIGR